MTCNTIILDQYNLFNNPEVRPFFYRLEAEDKLVVLQGRKEVAYDNFFYECIVDIVGNYGWGKAWQLMILLPVRELTRKQQGVEWAFTEKSMVQRVEQDVLVPLEGTRVEPRNTLVIMYDARDWDTMGDLAEPGEKARLNLDKSGIVQAHWNESVAFTTEDLGWVTEDWPKTAWFVEYNKYLAASNNAKIKEKQEFLENCNKKAKERLRNKIEEKKNLCEEYSNGCSLVADGLTRINNNFEGTLDSLVQGKDGLSAETPQTELSQLLKEEFSVSAFCTQSRIRLIRCPSNSEKSLQQLMYLVIVLIENTDENQIEFGTAESAWGWRTEITIDDKVFEGSMQKYVSALEACSHSYQEQNEELYRLKFIEKSRCPEQSRGAEISVEPVRKIKSKNAWLKEIEKIKEKFKKFIDDNHSELIEERDKITEKHDLETSQEFNATQLNAEKQNLSNEEKKLQGLLTELSFKDFDTVYTWPQKSRKLNHQVEQFFKRKPSLRTRMTLFIVAGFVLFVPILVTMYKQVGWQGLKQYQSWSLFLVSSLLLMLTSFLLGREERKQIRMIILATNDLISQNIKILKQVCRDNRAFLSSVCKLNVVFYNLREIIQKEDEIQLKKKRIDYLSHELTIHQDLQICRNTKDAVPVQDNGIECTIPDDFKPDVRILDVFYPAKEECQYTYQIGTAVEIARKSSSTPGLTKIRFFPDYLFEQS